MKRSLTITCMAALASICSLSQPLQAADVPVRKAVYSSDDAAVPTVNVSQVVVAGPVVVPGPVVYRPYRAYYRPYAAPYRAYYRPNVYRPYVAPYRPYRYGAAYAPYYSGYRGYYW